MYHERFRLKQLTCYWLLLGLIAVVPSWGAGGLPTMLVPVAKNEAFVAAGARTQPAAMLAAKGSASPMRATPAARPPAFAKPNGQVLVVVRGNSQANGAVTTGDRSTIGSETNGAWPDQAAALLGNGYTWKNRSKNGATIAYLRLSDAQEVAPLFHTGAYGEEWIVLQETTNQIFQGQSAKEVYGRMVDWAQYWRSQGVKVAVVTCYATQESQYNERIDAINTLYRANWSSFCDMLLDVKGSPYITQLGMDPKYGYSVDGLHLSTLGNQIPAHCAADGFGGSRTGIIPATFTLAGIAVPGGAVTSTPAPTTPTPTTPTNPTPTTPTTSTPTTTPQGTSLRLRYGTGASDYTTTANGAGIVQRLDQSGQGRVATITRGKDGPLMAVDAGQQVALFDPGRKSWAQSLTTKGALAANADASFVVDLRVLAGGANSVLSVGPDFSIWFQNSNKLQVFDKGGNYVSPVDFSNKGLTRCIFTFEASTKQMVLYVGDTEVYRATLAALPWVGTSPVLDLEQGSYAGGDNPLSGEMGTLAVYSGLLSASERTAWFANAPAANAATALSGLTAFAAAASGTNVNLTWSASAQKSSAQFEVERSTDGVTFSQVAKVSPSANGAAVKDYNLTDSQLPTAATTLYYRLRRLDASGVASYSAVSTVVLAPAAASLALYPNPASRTTRLQNAAPNATVQLLNGLGVVLSTTTTDATGTAELVLPAGLPAGIYLVRQGNRVGRLEVQ